VKYLTAEQVLFIHSRIIDETGGMHGIRDLGFLESAVSRPRATFRNKDLYPTSFHKAAALMESLVKNHPFIDGNKRTAITSAAIFLQMNGYLLKASHNELVDFAVLVAAGQADFNYEVAWFKKNTQSR
jgi:death-on-curing protein